MRPYIQQSAAGADETVQRAVRKALQKLDGRLSPSGRYIGTRTLDLRRPHRPRHRRRTRAHSRADAHARRRRSRRRRRPRRRRRARTLLIDTPGRRDRGAPPGRGGVVRSERSAKRRHDRGPLQVHSEDRQGSVRHRRARRGHRRRGATDPQVLERERRIRRGDAEALRPRAALLAADHAQERHPHLRLLVRRRRLRHLDGVFSVAHARYGNREREADAAERKPSATARTSASA